jgi:hypothetical protein
MRLRSEARGGRSGFGLIHAPVPLLENGDPDTECCNATWSIAVITKE